MTRAQLEKKYLGKPFVFHSPFEHTPGWEDADVGLIAKLLPVREFDGVGDMWIAFNVETQKFFEIWGLEAFGEKGRPVIPEHRALNWHP